MKDGNREREAGGSEPTEAWLSTSSLCVRQLCSSPVPAAIMPSSSQFSPQFPLRTCLLLLDLLGRGRKLQILQKERETEAQDGAAICTSWCEPLGTVRVLS